MGDVTRRHIIASMSCRTVCPCTLMRDSDDKGSVMRIFIAVLGLMAASAMSAPASAGCNVRGEFCGFPNWASNAFAGRKRVPESTLEPERYQPSFRVKRQSYRAYNR